MIDRFGPLPSEFGNLLNVVKIKNLIDLNAMSDDDINYEKHLSFLLYTMKHIHAEA